MKLSEVLQEKAKAKATEAATSTSTENLIPAKLRQRVHAIALDKIDMRNFARLEPSKVRTSLSPAIESLVRQDPEGSRLSADLQGVLVASILDEIAGLGPLEPLLQDGSISDILVNNANQVFVERGGKLELTNVKFIDNNHLINIIQRIVSSVGRRVDESSPLVDARLADGSRVNAVVPPIGADGAILSIRRFGKKPFSGEALVQRGVMTEKMLEFIKAAVTAKTNILVSGGTGSGKTTMLNVLSGYVPKHERVITIEDSLELALQGHHVVRMEARPPNLEGKGEVSIRACVKNALRMRPDRVIIGEIRGGEVLDMLQAMNTGHEGSMGTVHANTPKDAVDRLMMMLALAEIQLSNESMQNFISRSVRMVVQVARFSDGTRRCTHITEVEEDLVDNRVAVNHVYRYSPIQKRFMYFGTKSMERFAEFDVQFDAGQAPEKPTSNLTTPAA